MLNPNQALLIHHSEFCPNITADKLAKLTRTKSTNAAYQLRRLFDQGILTTRAVINPYALGYMDIALYFSLIDQNINARSKLIERIIKHQRVVHFGPLLGDYQYLIIFLTKNLNEIKDVINEIFQGAGDVFSDKLIAPRTSITFLQRKYLVSSPIHTSKIKISANSQIFEADQQDLKILSILGNKPFESIRSVATMASIPLTTAERRIKKLEQANVIAGYYNDVNVAALGFQSYRLLILKKGICATTSDKLQEFCVSHPFATFLVESVGAWDFEIGIETKTPQQVSEFIEALYSVCGLRIASIKVLQESDSHKCCMYPINCI